MAQRIVNFATDIEAAVEYELPGRPGMVAQSPRPVTGPSRRDGNATSAEIRFGPFRLLLRERRLERNGEAVPLGGRALDILGALVGRAGEVVTKAELSEAAWPGMIVEDGSLRFHIASLRKALGERAQGGSYLITVAGRGYCFTAEPTPSEIPATPAMARHADGVRIPATLRRIIGIESSIADAAAELAARRFLTLVGPPGIGKTTLAARLAHQLAESFADGIAFVDFGSVSGSHLVPNAVAAAIGNLLPAEQVFESLLAVLRDKRMLLIFDGCEHLVDAVAELAERLFRRLPMLAILATSRESLRVEGEHVYRLFPLGCPPEEQSVTAEDALAYPAVELFVDRVQASQIGYVLSDEDAPLVSEICRKLDGIPLALELAAGRVPSYGIRQTASLLDGRFRLLWQGRRTAPPRHQTLSAALDWSHDLLSSAERLVLRRISIFVGLFTLEAAKAISSDGDMPPDAIVAVLADLVSKSLVVLEEGDFGAKYRLLDTTRVYALAKLLAAEEAVAIVRRHATYLRDLLSAEGTTGAFFARPMINPYDDQIGNVRTALQWSFSTGEDDRLAASLAAGAAPLFLELSLVNESLEWANRGLSILSEDERGGMLEARLQAARGLALLALGGRGEEVECRSGAASRSRGTQAIPIMSSASSAASTSFRFGSATSSAR
jgi:predicted ATPase/DNA-binding winged helix-turn-helix (wHTH) protein